MHKLLICYVTAMSTDCKVDIFVLIAYSAWWIRYYKRCNVKHFPTGSYTPCV